MALIKFREDRCKGCGLCVESCPKKIIAVSTEINRAGYPVAKVEDMSLCTGCTFCAEICPDVVITVFK